GNGPVVDARRRRVGPGWTGRVVDRDLAEEGHAAHHHDADVAGALDDLVAGGPEPDLAGDVVVLDRDGGGGRRAEGGTAGGTGQHEDEGLVQLTRVSFRMGMEIVFDMSPALKVTVPTVAV